MRRKILLTFVASAVVLAGCSAPWHSEPDPDAVITPDSPPPAEDKQAARQTAKDFKEEAAEYPNMYQLGDSVEKLYGNWEKGSDRAIMTTELGGNLATAENGKRLANAFASWQNSETGESHVFVYAKDGDLLYEGRF